MAAASKYLESIRRVRIPYFRIWYSTTFTVLFGATVVLLAATPADLIYQAIRNDDLQNVFAIGGVTLLTAIIALLVYSTRLYTNRSVLAAIPKSFIPIDRGEVGRNIRKLIVRELHRSALIAWDSRPRDTRNELQNDEDEVGHWTIERIHQTTRRRSHIHDATVIPISASNPPWGQIEHAGWSSPASEDLPDLQFSSVIMELPNLIEAKAVSLAPPDPTFTPTVSQKNAGLATIPDERVVEILRRPHGLGLREYLGRLAKLDLVNPPSLAEKFLKQYEYARFSTDPLTEAQFRELMAVFAELLAGMTELDPAILIDILQAQGSFDSDPSSFAPSRPPSSTFSESSDAGSVRRWVTPGPSSAGIRSPSMVTARGSLGKYETPHPSSAGVRSPSMVTARTEPSRMRQASGHNMMRASAQSNGSVESFARTRQDLEDDGDDEAMSSDGESLQSAQSIVRHYSTAHD